MKLLPFGKDKKWLDGLNELYNIQIHARTPTHTLVMQIHVLVRAVYRNFYQGYEEKKRGGGGGRKLFGA